LRFATPPKMLALSRWLPPTRQLRFGPQFSQTIGS
jgi:hypothetical protein